MRSIVLFFTLIFSILFLAAAFVYACPVGQMENFDGSCIGDPNYNAGQVNSGSGNSQTTTIIDYSGYTVEQLQDVWDNQCRWGGGNLTDAQCGSLLDAIYEESQQESDSSDPNSETNAADSDMTHKSIGDFSSEGLDQQNTEGHKLIDDVDTMKQKVYDLFTSVAVNYSYEVYGQLAEIRDNANTISSNEYSAAADAANSFGEQQANCPPCYDEEDDGCQCKDAIQRQINVSSYTHFLNSFNAQQDAFNQISDYIKNNPPTENSGSSDKVSTNLDNAGTLVNWGYQEIPANPNSNLSIAGYYGQTITFVDTSEDAQNKLDATLPQGLEVINAKGDYEDALKNGTASEELQILKDSYDAKLLGLAQNIYDNVLSKDPTNSDALWQMGTLSKWNGENSKSYEYYREALLQEQHKNPFKYQQLLDSIKDPAIQLSLVQSIAPNENIINLPTKETSPLLKKLSGELDILVQPVKDVWVDSVKGNMRSIAKNIEKVSRAFSLSNVLDNTQKEMGFSLIGSD